MRGKEMYPEPLLRLIGITPAYAGKSVQESTAEVLPRDHPRLCGEKPALRKKSKWR